MSEFTPVAPENPPVPQYDPEGFEESQESYESLSGEEKHCTGDDEEFDRLPSDPFMEDLDSLSDSEVASELTEAREAAFQRQSEVHHARKTQHGGQPPAAPVASQSNEEKEPPKKSTSLGDWVSKTFDNIAKSLKSLPSWVPTTPEELFRAELGMLQPLAGLYTQRMVRTPLCDINTISFECHNPLFKHRHIVLVHGFGFGLGQWVPNWVALCGLGNVHAIDMPGFGRSGRPTFEGDGKDAILFFIQTLEEWLKLVVLNPHEKAAKQTDEPDPRMSVEESQTVSAKEEREELSAPQHPDSGDSGHHDEGVMDGNERNEVEVDPRMTVEASQTNFGPKEGRGESMGAGGTNSAEAEAEATESDGSNRKPEVVLVGHSFGGYVCGKYASNYPHRIKSVVLVDAFGIKNKPKSKMDQFYADASKAKKIQVWAAKKLFYSVNPLCIIRGAGPLGPSIMRKRKRRMALTWKNYIGGDGTGVLDYLYHCNAQTASGEKVFSLLVDGLGAGIGAGWWVRFPLEEELTKLPPEVDLVFINGQRSWIPSGGALEVTAARRRSHPDAHTTTHIVHHAGHHVYADQPEVFNRYMTHFLNPGAGVFSDKDDGQQTADQSS